MEEKKHPGIVPKHKTGISINAESVIGLADEEKARAFFDLVKIRLKNVNKWHEIAGDSFARFQLVNKDGIEVQRSPQKGDYFKIDIPGPGPASGKGYDWVRVEAIESTSTPEKESFGFRVRPAQNPQKNGKDIAHFFSHESTSSFVVTREGTKITAAIYDRNTKPNKDATLIVDKIRDMIAGTAGVLIFSKLQWKKLTDSLLDREEIIYW